MNFLKVPAQLKSLEQAQVFISECGRTAGLTTEFITRIEVVVEEAFVNICHYAYDGAPGDIVIYCRHEGSKDEFEIEIVDSGKPFDPLEAPPPDQTGDILKRHVGGLGILMVLQMTDKVSYSRSENLNHLFLTFYTTSQVK